MCIIANSVVSNRQARLATKAYVKLRLGLRLLTLKLVPFQNSYMFLHAVASLNRRVEVLKSDLNGSWASSTISQKSTTSPPKPLPSLAKEADEQARNEWGARSKRGASIYAGTATGIKRYRGKSVEWRSRVNAPRENTRGSLVFLTSPRMSSYFYANLARARATILCYLARIYARCGVCSAGARHGGSEIQHQKGC